MRAVYLALIDLQGLPVASQVPDRADGACGKEDVKLRHALWLAHTPFPCLTMDQ